MRKLWILLLIVVAALPVAAKDLEIYFIDVEGGQATLIIAPSGQTMLVDAGWPSQYGPGADRIAEVAKHAGVKEIDYMLMTHYHLDHVGGIPETAAKVPMMTFIDHGPDTETDPMAKKLAAAYDQVAAKGRHLVVKPGDSIPLKGTTVEVVAARGEAIATPISGAGAANPVCESIKPMAADATENARSVGFILAYGKFRFADLGDLTWNKELKLACPNSLVPPVDVYLVTHHGMDISNSPAILAALRPRVAIMNNGAKKGGYPKAFDVIKSNPGLEDLWQLHYSLAAKDANVAGALVANPEATNCAGHWIKLVAKADGSFTVTNGRNNFTKTYAAKTSR